MNSNFTGHPPPGTRRWAALISYGLCALAIALPFAGKFAPLRRSRLQVNSLAVSNGQRSGIFGSGFSRGAIFPGTVQPLLSGAIQLYGSWIGSDLTVGSAYSAWYDVQPDAYMLVAGYPSRPGLGLNLEIASAASHVTDIPVPLAGDPGLQWRLTRLPLQNIQLPAKFRVHAVDQSRSWGGWVGFSTPFSSPSHEKQQLGIQLLLILLTGSAALVMFISPGLLLRDFHFRRSGKVVPFIWLPVPGFLGCSLLGLLSWIGPSWLPPRLISKTGAILLFSYLVYRLFKSSIYSCTTHVERRTLFAALLLVLVMVAKSSYSVGPVGELYKDTISRTLEVGDRSDSRIPYHMVQLVALRERPHRAFAHSLLSPWSFSHRGPVVGLAASAIVLTAPVRPPATMPDQSWMPFDPEGFMAYRIAMIVIAATCLLMVFGISTCFISEEWAFLAFLITVTSPFIIHDIYFTWPKLEAACFVLLSAYLILKAKWFSSGLLLGIGYLCHPSALLSIPALIGLIALLKIKETGRAPLSRKILVLGSRTAMMLLGLGVWIGIWSLINRHDFDQSGFLNYFRQADRQVPTLANWLRVRLDSFLNTLVPLNLFLFHRNNPAVNSIDGPSPPVVQFFFQDWTGVPFGIGIIYFFVLLRLAYLTLRKTPAVIMFLYVVPLLTFTVYWGAASTGMLREGLHPWFLSLAIGSVIALEKFAASEQQLFRVASWAMLFRMPEILLMLLLPPIWSQQKWLRPEFALSDGVAIVVMLAGTVWLVILMFRQSERLRRPVGSALRTSPQQTQAVAPC